MQPTVMLANQSHKGEQRQLTLEHQHTILLWFPQSLTWSETALLLDENMMNRDTACSSPQLGAMEDGHELSPGVWEPEQ